MSARPAGRSPETGAVATEYALVAALVAVAIAATVALIGPPLATLFQAAADGLL